ncbi:hypothetical protein CERZMDRAFT_98427 [Cercospora zeae-maydis SCOH1-5]|uniref:Aflatoxin regulatory protein domain-containing protein n=1 Tax=Cercospora zeae-maydis SCOH1-5 TaxID=717836 RepID=A0A6A6FDW4_9PEZI|nr:hypothetical protein CERZMDRAFT_98427 [Cercospora zeae-maydis SCOH1-5]
MGPSAQKIRCGKERPRCERCSSKDICCNYSPSLRTGRHPGSVVDVESYNSHSNVANASKGWGRLDVATPDERHDPGNCFPGVSPWDKPLHGLADVGAPAHAQVALGCEWAAMNWMGASSSQAMFDWSPPEVEHVQHPQHDCHAVLLRLTAEQLHVPSQKCLRVDGQGGEGARCVRDVDSVLTANREAMQLLHARLGCVCMSDTSVQLAAYMVVYKMVCAYGAIVGGSEGGLEGVCGGIVDSPVFVGSYALDTAARRSVRARAVLNEVRQHVEPAVAKLPRFRAVSGRDEEESASSEGCMLRAELQRVIGVASSMMS